jgi:hypothetical protein
MQTSCQAAIRYTRRNFTPLCTSLAFGLVVYSAALALLRRGLHFLNVPHICQIKTGPSSRAMAQASFDFQVASRQIRRIAALTCENHNQFCVASSLVSRCGTC